MYIYKYINIFIYIYIYIYINLYINVYINIYMFNIILLYITKILQRKYIKFPIYAT